MNTKPNILALMVFATLSMVSCKENANSRSKKSQINTLVSNNKLEAKLLIKATQHNLDAIALCELLEKNYPNTSYDNIVNLIKKEQLEIYNNLQAIAKSNLILVSETVDTSKLLSNQDLDTPITTDVFITRIKENLEVQEAVLDSLIQQSDEDDIRQAVEKSVIKLKHNINATEEAVESLK